MNYIFFRKRPCRMLLKLLAGLREVFGRPLLHGKSIPPTLWTKLILRKLYSKNESAADHLIHFNIFYNACPTTMVKRGKLGHCSGREQCLTGQKRTTCHQSHIFSLLLWWVGRVSLFSVSFTPELRSQYEQQQAFTNVLRRNLLGWLLNMLNLLLTNWCQGQNLMKSSEKIFQQIRGSQRCGPAVKPV